MTSYANGKETKEERGKNQTLAERLCSPLDAVSLFRLRIFLKVFLPLWFLLRTSVRIELWCLRFLLGIKLQV